MTSSLLVSKTTLLVANVCTLHPQAHCIPPNKEGKYTCPICMSETFVSLRTTFVDFCKQVGVSIDFAADRLDEMLDSAELLALDGPDDHYQRVATLYALARQALFEKIAHGDETHRAWLLKEINDLFADADLEHAAHSSKLNEVQS